MEPRRLECALGDGEPWDATRPALPRILDLVRNLGRPDIWNLTLGAALAALTLVVAASGAFRAAWRQLRRKRPPTEALLEAARRDAAAADRAARAATEQADAVRRQLEMLQLGLASGAGLDTEIPAPPAPPPSQPDAGVDIEILGGGGRTDPDTGLRSVEAVLLFLSEREIFDLEFALLGPLWERDSKPVELAEAGQAGMWSVMRTLVPLEEPDFSWDEFVDRLGRRFACPAPAPAEREAWAVLSYERTRGRPHSIWQRLSTDSSDPDMVLGEPIGSQQLVDGVSPDDGTSGEAGDG